MNGARCIVDESLVEVRGFPPIRDEAADGWGTRHLWSGESENKSRFFDSAEVRFAQNDSFCGGERTKNKGG